MEVGVSKYVSKLVFYAQSTSALYQGEGGGGRGKLYVYRYSVTTRMTPALRWATLRATLTFH